MNFTTAMSQALKSRRAKQNRRAGTRAYLSGTGNVYLSRLFGYRLLGDHYEPVQPYAEYIRRMFEMITNEKKTLPEIKAELDKVKAVDSSRNRFSISRIVGILERPVYAAHLLQRGKLVPIRNMTAIVGLDVWKAAQHQLKIERRKLI